MTRHIAHLGACIVLFTGTAIAETEVGGLILEDTTWTCENSPYVVTPDAGGSIVVGAGATLTIEPCVEVRFRLTMGMTIGHTAWGDGCLIARGTEESPIIFTSNQPYEVPPADPAPGDWGRIYFTDWAIDAEFDEDTGEYLSGCILEYVTVQYAGSTGGTITLDNCSTYVVSCRIHDNNNHGVLANGINAPVIRLAGSEIWNCTVSAYGAGIALSGGTGHRLSGNFIHDCTSTSTGSYEHRGGAGMSVNATVTIEGNTIQNNTVNVSGSYADAHGGGIVLHSNSDGSTLSGNIVTGNSCVATGYSGDGNGGGIKLHGASACTVQDNTVSANTASHWGGGINLYNSDTSPVSGNDVSYNITLNDQGGGIYLSDSSGCNVDDNIITHNESSSGGGGLYFNSSADCPLTGNTITHNHAGGNGGGALFNNSGGVDNDLSDNIITHNVAASAGGGVYCSNSGSGTLSGNTVSNNSAGSNGGGIYLSGSGGRELQDNTISHNTVSAENCHGGGIYLNTCNNTMIQSCIITHNQTTWVNSDGGGIEFINSSGCSVDSCTITDNTAADAGGGFLLWQSSNFTMTDTVVMRNHTTSGTTGGIWVGGNDPSEDVSFEGDPDTGTYNTIYCNDGYQVANHNAYDADGSNDIDAGYVNWCTENYNIIPLLVWDYFDDSGCAFVLWMPPAPPDEHCCPADLNCDGEVNTSDLLILLGNWGCEGWGCDGDIDENAIVNTADLLLLLANWGECP